MTTFSRTETYTVSCPNNDDGVIVKIGFQSGKQRYRCNKCGKKFREPDVFPEGRHFKAQHIGDALQGYFDGQSYRQAARSLGRTFKTEPPDESTIFHWVQNYSRAAYKIMTTNKVKTGPEWVADEMVVRVGGKKYWLWNIMDRASRYTLAIHLTPKRDTLAAKILLRKAIEVTSTTPKVIKTDGLGSYVGAIKELFPKTRHIQSAGLDDPLHHNNHSERLQGTIRDRDKILRGLQSMESGQNYLDGWQVDYNYFRPHEGIGERAPAEALGIERPFRNWREVAERVDAKDYPERPDWQREIERIPTYKKDFLVMGIREAEEAIYARALRSKQFKSSKPFKARRGF